MPLFLCEHIALDLLRVLGDQAPRPTSSRSCLPPGAPPDPRKLNAASLHYLNLVDYRHRPLLCLVASEHERRSGYGIRCRIWASSLSPKSFAKLTDSLFISSPEFTFLQMAKHLSLIKLIELGFELCGRYAIDPASDGLLSRKNPLTTPEKLTLYLEKCGNVKGLKKARRAARYVLAGSESPMETKLALVLCLPPSMGGFGLPKATLNQELRLQLTDAGGNGAIERLVRCDLYWPAPYEVAIEYESNTWHLSNQKFSQDSIRRNDIVSSQVKVLTVTKDQILNLAHWPKLARQVADALGRKIETKVQDHGETQRRLYIELFAHLFA